MSAPASANDDRLARARRPIGIAGVAGLVLLGSAYWLTHEPAPRVRVLWAANVTPEQQADRERRYLLLNPRDRLDNGSLAYDLLDTSRSNLQAIVQDPAITDTGDIERNSLTIPFAVDYGGEWMWVAHRIPGLRHATLRTALFAVLSVMALWGLGPDAWRAWLTLRRAVQSLGQA